MGILDEAIREHLELKRQHGADDSELKQLEDQAFGQAERPSRDDSVAEAPTEFMSQPDLDSGGPAAQEPAVAPDEASERPPARREPAAGLADIQEAPDRAEDAPADQTAQDEPADEAAATTPQDEPVADEPSAAEHEAIAPPAAGHTTEERHAIADQPTEMFDVEEEFTSTEVPAPPDEDLVAEEISEARLGPAEPDAPLEVTAADEDEDDRDDGFFDEQRLSDELDQALEAPADREPEPISDEHEVVSDEPEPISDEHEAISDEHEVAEPRTEVHQAVPRADEREEAPAESRGSDEDVLDETPDFLEEAPEDDQLWFEQKPPKDFDFDD
jgi:hypothetical protein